MLPASPVAMYCLPCAAGRSTKKDEPKPADPESPWSSTWEEARGKFRDAAAARGAMLEVLRYTERDGFETVWSERNPEDLTIDVAILGDADSAPSMLIHQSGTHGVEGYTGSAIQIEYLRSAPPPPPGVAIVFVHGVNAHGMAEGRRWNERGVDLNRNYVGPRQGAVVDGTSDPVSFENLAKDPFDLYNKASELVNPVGILAIGGCCGAIEFYPKAASMIAKHGYSALKQAIAGGQYTRWSQALVEKKQQPGLFFGGLQHEQSTALVHGLVTRLGRQRTTALARAAHVDVHTALGESPDCHLIAIPSITRSPSGRLPECPPSATLDSRTCVWRQALTATTRCWCWTQRGSRGTWSTLARPARRWAATAPRRGSSASEARASTSR